MAIWEMVRLKNSPIKFRFDEGFSINLSPNEGASRLTYYFGVSEPALFKFYDQFLQHGMVVLDAGANIGLHALYFSKRVGSNGHVYSFEPDRKIFDRLLTHIDQNHAANVECLRFALGSKPGVVEVVHNAEDTSRTFVRNFSTDDAPADQDAVEVMTLDDFSQTQNLPRIDFLKIDVEGFEREILMGARGLLERNVIRVIQVELDQRSLGRAGAEKCGVVEILRANHYVLAKWNYAISRFEPANETAYNSLFVTKSLLEEQTSL